MKFTTQPKDIQEIITQCLNLNLVLNQQQAKMLIVKNHDLVVELFETNSSLDNQGKSLLKDVLVHTLLKDIPNTKCHHGLYWHYPLPDCSPAYTHYFFKNFYNNAQKYGYILP